MAITTSHRVPAPSQYVTEKARSYEAAGNRATWIGVEWIEGELTHMYRIPSATTPDRNYTVGVVSLKRGGYMLLCSCRAGRRDSRATSCTHRVALTRQLGQFSLDEVVA